MSEIPRIHRAQLAAGIPRCAKGYGPDEFLHFQLDPRLDPRKFRVLVQDLSARWVELSKTLQTRVLIPNTFFDPHATLVIVGLNEKGQQVRFVSEMSRGYFYVLNGDEPGDHTVQKFIPTYNL